jgi:putative membrane protein
VPARERQLKETNGMDLAAWIPWLKALHIIAVIAWMAGMLYLPRLFVYHADTPPGTPMSETFKVMERRLLRGIVNPAMITVFLLGGLLIAAEWPGIMRAGWFHAKIALLVLMTAVHGLLARWRKELERDQRVHTARFFRIVNEVPTVIMIAIVILAVTKPF